MSLNKNKENKYERILEEAKKKLRPTEEEEKNIGMVIDILLKVLSSLELGTEYNITLVGSIAKGTWLSNDHDIDIFLLFPPEKVDEFPSIVKTLKEKVPRALEKRGIKAVPEKKHANYPYLFLRSGKLSIDVVPAVNVELVAEEDRKILTPVDRTPLHSKYVKEKIEENPALADEIRLLKRFLKTIGTYGSEVKIRGFSGYLCELLIINLGSFIEVLKWFSETSFPAVFLPKDLEPPDEKDFEKWANQPLIFPDPTDRHRNVASVVTLENLLYTKLASKMFLHQPFSFFFEKIPPKKDLPVLLSKEKGKAYLLIIELEGVNEDIIWSQLWRNTKRLSNFFNNNYFTRSRVKPVELVTEKKYGFLLYNPEVESSSFSEPRELPLEEENVAEILERMKKLDKAYGPLIIQNKLVYFERRQKKRFSEAIKEFISNPTGFKWSKSVKKAIKKDAFFVDLSVGFKNYETIPEFLWGVEEILTGKKPWFRAWEEEIKKKRHE